MLILCRFPFDFLKCVCFFQMRVLNDFFEKLKGKKRTLANPMSSKQWKSFHESDNSAFDFRKPFFSFFFEVRNMMIFEVHLALLCENGDFG